MAITPLPTPPSTSDPTNFDVRADAFLGQLPQFADEANLLAIDVNANAVAADADAATATAAAAAASASAASAALQPTSPGTRAGSITLPSPPYPVNILCKIDQTNKTFVVGQWVSITKTSNPSGVWMLGAITAFTMGNGDMYVDVVAISGVAGVPHSGWTVSAASPTVVMQPVGSILYMNDAFGIF